MNTELKTLLETRFGKYRKNQVTKAKGTLAVKMTRVSGKKQMDGESFEVQNKAIDDYAKANHLSIVATFGDTHESAKTDDRKKFKRMVEFCKKSNGKVNMILVYKMSRFSRTGGGPFLWQKLLERNMAYI